MRSLLFALLLVLALPAGSALAASYQRTDGTIVDPILNSEGNSESHPYSGVDLAPGAYLQGSDLGNADLRAADLSNADLRTAILGFADLRDADLSGADLRDTNLFFTELGNANLAGANLSGSDNWQGVFSGANFTGAVWVDSGISETSIAGANFSFADLRGFWASESFAPGAIFAHADLDGSNLSINAQNADFTNASLRGVTFFREVIQADLSGANFSGADLTGVSFESSFSYSGSVPSAFVAGTNFSNAVLRNAIGLGETAGAALYDSQTDFTNAWADLEATIPFDPVAAGWTLVPEPGTALLMGFGLAGLAGVRRR